MTAASLNLPTSEERTLAALTHGSIILGPWGLLISALIWATQRERSTYVRFQALQALVYQICDMLLMMVFWLLSGAVNGVLVLFGIFPLIPPPPDPTSPAFPIDAFFSPMNTFFLACFVVPYFLIQLVLIAYALYGAYQTYRGQNFRYAIIGPRLERGLAQS